MQNLVNNVIGQLHGVNKMIEEKQGCLKVIVQMKAAKSALNSLIVKYLEANLRECVSESGKVVEKQKFSRLMAELMKK